MNGNINVVKIGGNVIDDATALERFLDAFAAMPGRKILVHGGGKEASRMCRSMGIEPRMCAGRRITDMPTLEVVTMVYAGLVNKRIVAALQARRCNAVGLTGADGDAVTAVRRDPVPVDYGFVGDIDVAGVNVKFIESLLEQDCVPVFCAICHDGRGSLLNCNADSVASAIAMAAASIAPARLTYCFEKAGVMTDVDDDSSVIPLVTEASFATLRDKGVVDCGMLPKLENALRSAAGGVTEVRICSASDSAGSRGTIIRTR